MKKVLNSYILIVLILVICFGCGDNNNTTQRKSNPKNDIHDNQTNPSEQITKEQLLDIISGIWVPKKYADKLNSTKSAYEASSEIPLIAEMQINPASSGQDTLYVTSSLNNHEGYGFHLYLDSSLVNGFIRTDAVSKENKNEVILKWSWAPDTVLKLEEVNSMNKVVNTTSYIRISKSLFAEYGGNGYSIIARKTLFNGTYVLESTGDTVAFKIDGTVDNFALGYYDIITDFGGGPAYEGNQIHFRSSEEEFKEHQNLIFEFQSDTIIFFRETTDSLSYMPAKGELVERLIKVY